MEDKAGAGLGARLGFLARSSASGWVHKHVEFSQPQSTASNVQLSTTSPPRSLIIVPWPSPSPSWPPSLACFLACSTARRSSPSDSGAGRLRFDRCSARRRLTELDCCALAPAD